MLDSRFHTDSGFQILDSSLCQRELGFWLPIASALPDFKAQDSGFNMQIWNVKMLVFKTRGKPYSTRRKTSRSKGENQTQLTYGVDSGI